MIALSNRPIRSAAPRAQRRVMAACSNRDRKGIFQLDSEIPISIAEARDAYDVCRSIVHHGDYSSSSYNIFRVDGEMVERYINIVEDLENMYIKTKIRTEPAKIFRLGPFKFYFMLEVDQI